MALSRQRQRELRRLKRSAEELWSEQRDAIEHAAEVLRDASRQAARAAREDIGSRVRDTYEDRVRPAFAGARSAASTARERFSSDVVPALTGTIGSALAALETARHPRVRDAARKVSKAGQRAGVVTPPKSGPGPGGFILIGLGVIAVAGIAYAAWQTLRADDDLWIEDLGDPGSADIGDDDEF